MTHTLSVRERALNRLRRAIIVGELVPGQRLVEQELVKKLGVSRPTLREIFSQLLAERLVKLARHRGLSVAEISWQEADEIYEVRELLEAHAASLFAKRATGDEIAAMRLALDRFHGSINQPIAGMELLDSTEHFYDVMLQGCHNLLIGDILRGQLARISLLRARSMSRSGRTKRSWEELNRILNAVEAGDPESARVAAIEHVRQAREAARATFQNRIFGPIDGREVLTEDEGSTHLFR